MPAVLPGRTERDIAAILRRCGRLPASRPSPALVALVGLPGSGKSWVAEELRRRAGALVLESDDLRKALFRRPTYRPEESRRLFDAIHAATGELLRRGVPVILDATNLIERERQPLYDIAGSAGARLILVRVVVPRWLVHRRLAHRTLGVASSRSEAGVEVYERMRATAEPLRRRHYVVDTSRDTEAKLRQIAAEMEEQGL